jgi:hypothetical protein
MMPIQIDPTIVGIGEVRKNNTDEYRDPEALMKTDLEKSHGCL